MGWRPFVEAPGERPGDDVLLEYIDVNLDVGGAEVTEDSRFALLAWQAGSALIDDPIIRRVTLFAWHACVDPALKSALGPDFVEGDYVMERLADLAVKRLAATTR